MFQHCFTLVLNYISRSKQTISTRVPKLVSTKLYRRSPPPKNCTSIRLPTHPLKTPAVSRNLQSNYISGNFRRVSVPKTKYIYTCATTLAVLLQPRETNFLKRNFEQLVVVVGRTLVRGLQRSKKHVDTGTEERNNGSMRRPVENDKDGIYGARHETLFAQTFLRPVPIPLYLSLSSFWHPTGSLFRERLRNCGQKSASKK